MTAIYNARQHICDFETDLSYRVVNGWARTLQTIWWPRVMIVEPPSASRTRLLEWNQETARIHYLGPKGKDFVPDPLATAAQEITYDHYGNGLKLDRSQISDDKIDRAAKWATETGAASLYWPQRLASLLMINGKTTTNPITGQPLPAYDGGAFFRKGHPVGGASSKTYSNLHNGLSFTAENVARVVAYIETIEHGGAAPAGLMPTIIIAPTNFRLKGTQITQAEWFTDVLNGAAASAQNAFKMALDFEPPIFAPELNAEPTVWYVSVPADQDAFEAGLGYWEREPFTVNTYQPASNWELAKVKEFVWENYGRNGAFYGEPRLLHRIEESGSIDSYLPEVD